jgi:hypothetical protein
MTFSNGIQPKRTKNIIIVPYGAKPSVPRASSNVSPPTPPVWNTIDHTETMYYMKSSMIGRIMNHSDCIMCPKH